MIRSKNYNFRAKTVMGRITSCDIHVNANSHPPHTRHSGDRSNPHPSTIQFVGILHAAPPSRLILVKYAASNNPGVNASADISPAADDLHGKVVTAADKHGVKVSAVYLDTAD